MSVKFSRGLERFGTISDYYLVSRVKRFDTASDHMPVGNGHCLKLFAIIWH